MKTNANTAREAEGSVPGLLLVPLEDFGVSRLGQRLGSVSDSGEE